MARKTSKGNPLLSFSLFFIQMVLFVFLVFMIEPPVSLLSTLLFLKGLFVGIWAVMTMKKSKLNALPDIALGATLVTDGPYKYIRHPMYYALLLVGLASVLNDLSVLRIGLFTALVVVLSIKLNYEESLLKKEFSGYEKYMKKTKRLVPFLF
jgi:protein-S-isoprenylcysteine O-methyltransferase Ste14